MVRNTIISAIVLFAFYGAQGTVYYVAKTGDNGHDGSESSPWLTIQHAIDSATQSDEIRVAAGVYQESLLVPYNSGKNFLVLKGGYNAGDWGWNPIANPTVVESPSAAADVVELRAVANSVIGMTLRNGRYGVNGRGGITSQGTYLVSHCIISNNANHAIRIQADGGVKSTIKAHNLLIADNKGDGIYINIDSGQINEILNCTIVRNGGSGYYDIHNFHKGTTMANTIIADNGKYGFRSALVGHPTTRERKIYNSVIYGNKVGNIQCDAYDDDAGDNLRVKQKVFNGYPAFSDPDHNDFTLSAASPCIGRGMNLNSYGVTNDIAGAPRAGAWDLGCFQSAYAAPARLAQTYADAGRPDDSGDGATPQTAKKTIGAAAAVTAPGGTCSVAPGIYHEDIILSEPITVIGAGPQSSIITNAATLNNGLNICSTNVTVRGLGVRGGVIGILMGTIYSASSFDNQLLEQCHQSDARIGILVPRATGLVTTQRITLNSSVVSNNTSTGVYLTHRHAIVARNSLIVKNGGGGIRLTGDNCPYENFIYNCTIADNNGSGVVNEHASGKGMTIINSVLSHNGGYGVSQPGSAYDYTISYSLVYGNGGGNFNGPHLNNRLVLGRDIIAIDPSFVGAGNYRLSPGSYAAARGRDLSGVDFPVIGDLEGATRTLWDLGCFESGQPAATLHSETYVDAQQADDSGDGLTAATAKKQICSAVAMTAPGGTVHVGPGAYHETLVLNDNVTVQGDSAASPLVSNKWYSAWFSGTNATVNGIAFATVGNYAVRFNGARNTLRKSWISGGKDAGVLVTAHGNLVQDSTVTSNKYGVYVNSNSQFLLGRCRLVNNSSHGAYCSSKGALMAVNSLFADNSGDGVYFLSDNSSYTSGFDFCTFAGNGGNGYRDNQNWHKSTTIRNSIISDNGGYGMQRAATNNHDDYISYSLVYGNAKGDFSGNRIVQQSGMITNAPPLFAATGWNARKGWRLTQPSPCRDTAADIGVNVDLAGTPRPKQQGFDMGAYEFTAAQGTTLLLR